MNMQKDTYSSRKECFFYILLAFGIIFFSHDTLFFGTNENSFFITFGKIFPFILIFLLVIYAIFKNIKFRSKSFFKFLIFAVLPLISCFINGETINNYVYRFAITFAVFLLISITNKDKFLASINTVMSFLTIWSLAFFLIVNLFPSTINYFPKVVNSAGYSYVHSFFSTSSYEDAYGFARNEGIFREPGVFMCFLTLSILIELFALKKISKKRLVVFIIGIISTFSTAGMIVLILLSLSAIITQNNLNLKWKKGIFILLVIVAVFMLTFQQNLSFISVGLNKFQYGSNSYGSFYARMQSVVGNISIFFNNPIIGVGRYHLYDTTLASQAVGYGAYEAVDNTNTFLVCFSAFGFLYGFIACYGAYRFIHGNKWNFISSLIAFMVLFIAFSNEDLGQNYLFFYLVLSGLLMSRKVTFPVREKIGAPCNA